MTSAILSARQLEQRGGGLSFARPKDLVAAVRDAIADTRTVYVARYAVSDSMFNGKDHAVKIETKRKDVKLRA